MMLSQDAFLSRTEQKREQSTLSQLIQASTYEIHSLSHQVVSLLVSQQSGLDIITDNIDESLDNVSAGNEIMQKTANQSPAGFRIVVFYILLFIFALLYMDWINK